MLTLFMLLFRRYFLIAYEATLVVILDRIPVLLVTRTEVQLHQTAVGQAANTKVIYYSQVDYKHLWFILKSQTYYFPTPNLTLILF